MSQSYDSQSLVNDEICYSTGKKLEARLGIDAAPADLHPPEACGIDDLCWTFGTSVSLNISTTADGRCYRIEWLSRLDGLKVL